MESPLLLATVLLAAASLALYHRLRVLEARIPSLVHEEARRLHQRWVEEEKQRLEESIRRDYEARLREWISREEKRIRRDAVARSVSTILGRVAEHIAPVISASELGADPRDYRYLGSPVDYIVFKGLSGGRVEEIIFLEVKSGKRPVLSPRERSVRDAVLSCRIRYHVFNARRAVEEAARRAAELVEEDTGSLGNE